MSIIVHVRWQQWVREQKQARDRHDKAQQFWSVKRGRLLRSAITSWRSWIGRRRAELPLKARGAFIFHLSSFNILRSCESLHRCSVDRLVARVSSGQHHWQRVGAASAIRQWHAAAVVKAAEKQRQHIAQRKLRLRSLRSAVQAWHVHVDQARTIHAERGGSREPRLQILHGPHINLICACSMIVISESAQELQRRQCLRRNLAAWHRLSNEVHSMYRASDRFIQRHDRVYMIHVRLIVC